MIVTTFFIHCILYFNLANTLCRSANGCILKYFYFYENYDRDENDDNKNFDDTF